MNDNCVWQRAVFVVPCGNLHTGTISGEREVEGMAKGPFGVFCYDHNDMTRASHYRRVSVTHLPTGRVIAHTDSGATALRMADALMEHAADFLRPMTEAHRKALREKVVGLVHGHNCLLGSDAA